MSFCPTFLQIIVDNYQNQNRCRLEESFSQPFCRQNLCKTLNVFSFTVLTACLAYHGNFKICPNCIYPYAMLLLITKLYTGTNRSPASLDQKTTVMLSFYNRINIESNILLPKHYVL